MFIHIEMNDDNYCVAILFQLCTGGSVTDLVQGLRNRNGRLKEDHIAYILHETLKGLVHLHENHCMHR